MNIQKWEYLVLNWEPCKIAAQEPNWDYAGLKTSDALAKAGGLGWELVSVTNPHFNHGNHYFGAFFFKRRA